MAVVAAVVLLGGCAFADEALMPSLNGEEPAGGEQQAQGEQQQAQGGQQPAAGEAGAPPALGTGTFEPQGVTRFEPTGTFVGKKVQNLREDLVRLQGQIGNQNGRLQQLRGETRQATRAYHELVAAINSRLQVGTTPGNPELVSNWNQAQSRLEQVNDIVSRMNSLSNDVASTSRLASFLLESVQAAYGLSGAVEEDHRQLQVLEDETNRTVVLIDRLLNELSQDLSRQTNYLASERANLSTLAVAIKNGEFYGGSLANRAYGGPPPETGGPSGAAMVGQRQPLVVVRFDGSDVQYKQALYNAVSRALDRRPQAAFDVVAVAPAGGGAERQLDRAKVRRRAEEVMRALMDLGLPPERLSLAATTSQSVSVNEVHVYVR